jgi:hypothetical protein
MLGRDHKTSRPSLNIFIAKNLRHSLGETPPIRRVKPDQQNSVMRSRSESTQVREIKILCDEKSFFSLRDHPHVCVRFSQQTFFRSRVHVMTQVFQDGRQTEREILV